MIDYTKLRELAQQATPGPWETGATHAPGQTYFGTVVDPDDPTEPGILLGDAATYDAEFIAAANPTVVLALLDELRDVQDKVRSAKADGWDDCARWSFDSFYEPYQSEDEARSDNPYREEA